MPAGHEPMPCDKAGVDAAPYEQLEKAFDDYWGYWIAQSGNWGVDAKERFEAAYARQILAQDEAPKSALPAPSRTHPPKNALRELGEPGSTAIGYPLSVLARWGAPLRTAQLGDVTLHIWMFSRQQANNFGPAYTGQVDRYSET